MVEKKDFMDDFLAKKKDEVYVLSIVVMQNGKKVLESTKEIDAYPGEVGKRYASKLLLRMGNNAVKGKELERVPWMESKDREIGGTEENFSYIKSTENGTDYILAKAIWQKEKIHSEIL